jgi:hypothetical protein
MANAYMGIYKGSVTSGGSDGTRVSEDPTNDAATSISATLNATNNEVSSDIKLAIRCLNANNRTVGDTTIAITGTTAAKWQLAPDNAGSAGTYGAAGATLTIVSVIGNTNTLFWAKCSSSSDEGPANDNSVDLEVTATIEAF